MSENNLTIDLSEEYKIKIEDTEDLKKSFFANIYRKAAEAVKDIITQTERNDPDKNKKLKKDDPFLNEQQDYNNIIAFSGERGTGKSSAMITFAQSLTAFGSLPEEFYPSELKDKIFQPISVIDPSLFEEGENIFEVILAQLFSRFEKELEKKETASEVDKKRKLLEQFEKVYENLQTIKKNGQKYDGEALETLSKLACGANLRSNFKDLIKHFLDFITTEKKDSYLIIPIDDFDLNVNAVADMAEQIRKYLMIPQVIVLMAANIEQLAEAIELDFSKTYNDKIKIASSTIKDKTQSYLTKLIPENRRLKLEPNIYGIASSIEIIWNKDDDFDFPDVFKPKPIDRNNPEGKQHIEHANAKKFIQILTFKKTGFYTESIDIFIPSRIREFKEFLILLVKQKDWEKYENTQKLKSFIFDKVISPKLSQNEKEIYLTWQNTPVKSKNFYICNALYNQIRIKYEERLQERHHPYLLVDEPNQFRNKDVALQLSDILNKTVNESNISIGDVLLLLKYFTRSNSKSEKDIFIISLKAMYSLELLSLFHENNLMSLVEVISGNVYNPFDIKPLRSILSGEVRHYFSVPIDAIKDINEVDTFLHEWLIFFISRVGVKNNRKEEITLFKQSVNFRAGTIEASTIEFNILNFISTMFNVDLQKERLWGEDKNHQDSFVFNQMRGIGKDILNVFLNIDVIEQVVNYEFTPLKTKIRGSYSYHFEKFVEEFIVLLSEKYGHLFTEESSFTKNNPLLEYFSGDELKKIAANYSERTSLLSLIELPDDNLLSKTGDELEKEFFSTKELLHKKIKQVEELDYLNSDHREILIRRFKIALMLNNIFFSSNKESTMSKKGIESQKEFLTNLFNEIRKIGHNESFNNYIINQLPTKLKDNQIILDFDNLRSLLQFKKRLREKREEVISQISKVTNYNE